MKTFAEFIEWSRGAEEQFGDASVPICQLFFRWVDNPLSYAGEDLVCGLDGRFTIVHLIPGGPIRLPLQTGDPSIGHDEVTEIFGAQKIAPGIWAITPSLNIPFIVHAFAVFYDVPEPEPWENLIVVAQSMPAVPTQQLRS